MKREKIELAGMTFKFKKDLKEYTQNLIKQKGLCTINNTDKDFTFFVDLFFRKPYNKIYLGKVKAFKIDRNPITLKIGHMFWIDYYDKEQTFSWNKCIDERDGDTYNFKLSSACRVSINEQREECWYSNDKCNKCSKSKINREFDIDHDNINFSHIVEEFDSNWKGKKPTKFKKEPTTCQYIFSDEDKLYKDEFQKFHKLKANLQLLCKECHADKTFGK
jgi:hypothetical protein